MLLPVMCVPCIIPPQLSQMSVDRGNQQPTLPASGSTIAPALEQPHASYFMPRGPIDVLVESDNESEDEYVDGDEDSEDDDDEDEDEDEDDAETED